jgi:type I restriction enzyme R subunit
MASNFDFLRGGWPELADVARRAEFYAASDPRASLVYSRHTLARAVHWLYRADSTLSRPSRADLVALTDEPAFTRLVGPMILTKMQLIRKQGNNAVHRSAAIVPTDSIPVTEQLFHVLIWIATHYILDAPARRRADITFDTALIPVPQPGAAARTLAQITKLNDELAAQDAELVRAERTNTELAAQVRDLQAEVAAAKIANSVVVDPHDYREDETRDLFIDVLLGEAGWPLDDARDTEFAVTGIPGGSGRGFVDYVLWGQNGLPLALVEAKRTRTDATVGQQQARLYADALEATYGQRPVIFFSNGYEHFLWDDTAYPPRRVDGFYTRDQLELLVQRRSTRTAMSGLPVSVGIADRHYQQRAVRKVAESFEGKQRRALLVMATGSGKTRTVIALADLMIRANWAKRILFLADRRALVSQATNAFKSLLSDSAPVNLVTDPDSEGRVYLSTYPTMMGLINSGGSGGSGGGGLRRFGPGYFDLIIVDEAHRSVYQKYGAIFSYFDALLVGLTATPKDEIDHNTYGLFNLEDGIPTDSYDLTDAIAEGYLVPPVGRSIATKFVREGIHYDELSEAEKEAWDLLEWVDGDIPNEVDASALNSWLFNKDTVDTVLETLMVEGRRVAGGDRLAKTIIFAKNTKHANFIAERFDANYPEFAGSFARVITHQIVDNESLIEAFSRPHASPHIAISVDMLDTGIDVPDVANLVFFKPVHSKTKYWQMVGRGTRLRPDLYGPGNDKRDFVIFDVCQNIEFFNQDLPSAGAPATRSLGHRLFRARLQLLEAIEGAPADAQLAALREGLAARMHERVTGMNLDNFLVRRNRREVERFSDAVRWQLPQRDDFELAATLADLPSAVDVLETDEMAKRFDLFALRAQLGVLTGDPEFASAQARVQQIAHALAEQKSIPSIASNIDLIAAVAGDQWWVDVTVPMLEMMRIRLRGLVSLIDSSTRPIVYTDFADSAADGGVVELRYASPGVDRVRFREKALAFLSSHLDHAVLFKVRHGKQLTVQDLDELERIMVESGLSENDVEDAAEKSAGLGLFVRSLVGLDRVAATNELSGFTAGTTLTGNQQEFMRMLVDQLTSRGDVDPVLLFDAPFTDVAPIGPTGLFSGAQVTELVSTLRRIRRTAQAS